MNLLAFFLVCALCSCVFSFLQSLPPPPCSPFQFVPLFHCVFHTFLVCVFCPVVSVFLVSVPPPFLQPLPLPFYLSFVYASWHMPYIFLVCLSFQTLFLPAVLYRPSYLRPWAFRFPLCVFSASLPRLPGAIPPFPRRLFLLFLFRSRVFLPLFSAPFLSFVFH